jgi:hypothetical protein
LEGNLAAWLDGVQPDIVLLHIGTNWIQESEVYVEAILDEICKLFLQRRQ